MMDDWPSVSVASDLSRLACIYDEANLYDPSDTESPPTTPQVTTPQTADWDDWRAEFEQSMADACRDLRQAFGDDVPGCD